jgi:ATP-binding cassette subfamily B protein
VIPREQLALVRRALSFVRPYRGRSALAGACVITQALLQLVPVLIFRALVDHLTAPHPGFAGVAGLLGAGLAALLAAGLVSVLASYLSAQVAESVVYDLRQRLYEHLIEQSVGYFTRRRSGEILSHLVNDVSGIETALMDSALIVIRDGCLLAAMVVLMFVLDWRLAVLTLVVVPALLIPFRYAGNSTYRSRMRVQDELSELTAHLHETLSLSGLMLVKAFSRAGHEKRRFAAHNDELRRRQLRAARATRWLEMGLTMLQAGGPTVLLLLGGLFITQGSSRLGTVLAFSTVIVAQLGASAGTLSRAALSTAGSLSMWQRIFRVLDEAHEITDRPGALAVEQITGAIRFEAVTFSYPGADRPALREVEVSIEPGQLVALVGPSGAGKSTFAALLARLIDPDAGSITLDRVDLRDLRLESVHRAIGIVFQDAFLFHASLRENLRYGRPGASDEAIWAAARDAHLEPLMRSLPDGLDTVVGERGFRLSGGEKQRVAIARVLLKDPRILLLDEATAHLDNASERLIQETMQRLFRGRTSLVIAHRLSTVVAADTILVLDSGRIVERGNHEELLAAGGLYAGLVEIGERSFRSELPLG